MLDTTRGLIELFIAMINMNNFFKFIFILFSYYLNFTFSLSFSFLGPIM